MNSSTLSAMTHSLQLLGFALIVGGILCLGAFVAPVLFREIPRADAGAILVTVFRRFDMLLLGALGMVLVGEAARLLIGGWPGFTWLSILRSLLLVALTGLMFLSTLKVNAEIAEMQVTGKIHSTQIEERQAFLKTHALSEKLYKAQCLLAALLLLLAPLAMARSES